MGRSRWADPSTGLSCVIFTAVPSFNESDEKRHLSRLASAAVRFSVSSKL
jgi:hypothetical protein